MSVLEQRYRRLLRLLPADHLAAWQEEMVTTFLASMHTGDAEGAPAAQRQTLLLLTLAESAAVLAVAVPLAHQTDKERKAA